MGKVGEWAPIPDNKEDILKYMNIVRHSIRFNKKTSGICAKNLNEEKILYSNLKKQLNYISGK